MESSSYFADSRDLACKIWADQLINISGHIFISVLHKNYWEINVAAYS